MKGILQKDFVVDEKYTIKFFLKKGDYAESYRVKDREGVTRYLKLIEHAKLKANQYTEDGRIREVVHLRQLQHKNLIALLDSGTMKHEDENFSWVVTEFINGETLQDRLKRHTSVNVIEAKELVIGVLEGLEYLHNLEVPIVHNEITNLNIMTDLGDNAQVPKIIDFGYARDMDGKYGDFDRAGLNQIYLAPECLADEPTYSPQSDIYAVGVLLYHLIFGVPPWSFELSKYKANIQKFEEMLTHERSQPLKFVSNSAGIDQNTLAAIAKAVKSNPEERFKTAAEFVQALKNEIKLEIDSHDFQEGHENIRAVSANATSGVQSAVRSGDGFAAIAGMEDLKEMVKTDVIDALKDKEQYAEFGLSIPNGMLLYGPPGCGKTYFAERFAEEIGFRFYQIKPSDLQSKYVNATQENIGALFEEARQNSPSIVFIDELDALVPDRNSPNMNHMSTAAVNEFLAQMNNSGDAGVFVIGATNRPDAIDSAILRAGRLDKVVYIPPPDFDARHTMFELILEKRPTEGEMDYKELAGLTENFVSSDIRFLCDEASRAAIKGKTKITQSLMEQTIKANKPSISISEINEYVKIKAKFEGTTDESRTSIGFKRD